MGEVAIRVPVDDEFAAIIDFDGRAFGSHWPEEHRELARATLDLDRFRIAHDGDQLVGVAGSYEQDVTVPGGAQLRAGGITWVAVASTHRRQGILIRLMDAVHDDIDRRGEPIAMLTASEGGIYERFGYGVASHLRIAEIDRRRTQVRPEFRPPPGTVRLTTSDDPALPGIFDRYRRGRAGEINRTEAHDALDRAFRGPSVTVALHADGFASWKITQHWNEGHPAHELELLDLVAITPEAHAALWHNVLSVDLVGPVRTRYGVAPDDALPYIVDDPRAVRTTGVNDMLWLNIRDVGTALGARTYGTDDSFVLEVDLGDRTERWRVAGGPGGAEARKVRRRPDVRLDRASLGAIYLGGVRPSLLARAGRIAASDDVLRRADAFFMGDRLPTCITGF